MGSSWGWIGGSNFCPFWLNVIEVWAEVGFVRFELGVCEFSLELDLDWHPIRIIDRLSVKMRVSDIVIEVRVIRVVR